MSKYEVATFMCEQCKTVHTQAHAGAHFHLDAFHCRAIGLVCAPRPELVALATELVDRLLEAEREYYSASFGGPRGAATQAERRDKLKEAVISAICGVKTDG